MHCKCCSRDYITSHVTHRNPFNPENGINTAGVTLRGLQKQDMCQAAFLLSRLKVQPPMLPCRHQNKHCHALKSKLHQCEFLLECECVCFQCIVFFCSTQCHWMGEGVQREDTPFYRQIWKATFTLKGTAGCSCLRLFALKRRILNSRNIKSHY